MQVLTVDYQSPEASRIFAESLHNTGFAVLKNHPLDWNLIEGIYREWEEFFKDERRHQYFFSEEVQDGYYPPAVSEVAKGEKIKDLKEFYHLYFPQGRYPDFMSDQARRYFASALELARKLMVWIEQALPSTIQFLFHEPLSNTIDPSKTLLRILHYPPQIGELPKGAIRAAANEDINWITLLPAETEPGLQVQDKENRWYDVETDPRSLVINIGDMLEEATGGYYISTTHRVINPAPEKQQKSRMSMPLFVHARPDIKLSDRYTAYLTLL